jgi:hypothetical protein
VSLSCSVRKLNRSKSEMKSTIFRAAASSFGQTLIFRRSSGPDGLAPTPQLRGAFRLSRFLCSSEPIPYFCLQGICRDDRGKAENLFASSAGTLNSLHFPPQIRESSWRRVRPRLPPLPLSLGCRDLPLMAQARSRNSRDSAGFWRFGVGESEPETADFWVIQCRRARLSLLPIPAVRFGKSLGRGDPEDAACKFASWLGGFPSVEPRASRVA